MRTAAAFATSRLAAASLAQSGKTKEGFSLQWDKAIAVVPDSLASGTRKFPAWTISIHEGSVSEAMGWWMNDMQAVSAAVTKGKPAKAMGLRLGEVPQAAMAMAAVEDVKRAGLVHLTMAFCATDSTTATPADGQEAYMRALAVKYNRAVVQAQLAAYEKQLSKAGDRLADTKGDVAKSQARLTKEQSRLQQVKAKRGKLERSNARISGDITGLEKKFGLSNDPKDLQRLTKARTRLARGEAEQAKLMQQEAAVQADIAKEQGRLEANSGKAEERGESKELLQRTVDALKRKHDAIN
jgi:hypothetical protein